MSLEAKRVDLPRRGGIISQQSMILERETKTQARPSQVSTDRRKALADSGERLSDQSEWLTKTHKSKGSSRD